MFRSGDLRTLMTVVRQQEEPTAWRAAVRDGFQRLVDGDISGALPYMWDQQKEQIRLLGPIESASSQMVDAFGPHFGLMGPADLRKTFASGLVKVLSESYDDAEGTTQFARRIGAFDWCILPALDASGVGTMIGIGCERRVELTTSQRRVLSWLVAHVTAQVRAQGVGVSAIFAPSGRVLHATPDAESSLATLAEVTQHLERSGLRDVEPAESLRAWSAITLGKWALVEMWERDGRRFYLAKENEPVVRDGAATLTQREQNALHFLGRGHSLKLIAYELGATTSQVHRALQSAKAKLGVTTHAELIRVARSASAAKGG